MHVQWSFTDPENTICSLLNSLSLNCQTKHDYSSRKTLPWPSIRILDGTETRPVHRWSGWECSLSVNSHELFTKLLLPLNKEGVSD